MECMELMMIEQSKERVFEKDFVPEFLFFFPGIMNEFTKLVVHTESWKKTHIKEISSFN
jgi:hypothetical protein